MKTIRRRACRPLIVQTGIEFRESAYLLGPKIARTLRKDMVFSLHLSLHDIEDPKDAKKKCVVAPPTPI